MAKKRIAVPKGYKDCNGVECDKNYEFEVDIPETQPTVTSIPQISVTGNQPQQAQQMQIPPVPQPPTPEPTKSEEKKVTHEELSEMIPNGVNAMSCPGGDCGHMKLKNKKQTKKWKACPHCEANTVPKDNEFCPYCTKNIDPEDLEDGIELETKEDDEEE